MIRALAAEGYLGTEALDRIDPEIRRLDWLDALPFEAGIVDPVAFFSPEDLVSERVVSGEGGDD